MSALLKILLFSTLTLLNSPFVEGATAEKELDCANLLTVKGTVLERLSLVQSEKDLIAWFTYLSGEVLPSEMSRQQKSPDLLSVFLSKEFQEKYSQYYSSHSLESKRDLSYVLSVFVNTYPAFEVSLFHYVIVEKEFDEIIQAIPKSVSVSKGIEIYQNLALRLFLQNLSLSEKETFSKKLIESYAAISDKEYRAMSTEPKTEADSLRGLSAWKKNLETVHALLNQEKLKRLETSLGESETESKIIHAVDQYFSETQVGLEHPRGKSNRGRYSFKSVIEIAKKVQEIFAPVLVETKSAIKLFGSVVNGKADLATSDLDIYLMDDLAEIYSVLFFRFTSGKATRAHLNPQPKLFYESNFTLTSGKKFKVNEEARKKFKQLLIEYEEKSGAVFGRKKVKPGSLFEILSTPQADKRKADDHYQNLGIRYNYLAINTSSDTLFLEFPSGKKVKITSN